jgi:hypothetical protein
LSIASLHYPQNVKAAIIGYQQLWILDAKLKELNEQTGIHEKLQVA